MVFCISNFIVKCSLSKESYKNCNSNLIGFNLKNQAVNKVVYIEELYSNLFVSKKKAKPKQKELITKDI